VCCVPESCATHKSGMSFRRWDLAGIKCAYVVGAISLPTFFYCCFNKLDMFLAKIKSEKENKFLFLLLKDQVSFFPHFREKQYQKSEIQLFCFPFSGKKCHRLEETNI